MSFINFAITFFGRTEQRNEIGVSQEAHRKLIVSLNDALQKLSLTEEQKTQALVELAERKGDLASINGVVSGFLQAIYKDEVPPEQFAATLFRLIEDWREAGARIDALGASRNLTPHIAGLREAASKAHAQGDLAEAGRLLDRIDQEELRAEQRLLEHSNEIAQEIALRRQGRIATKDAQIAVALSGLRHAAAARLIVEKIDLLEADAEKRFASMRSEQDVFYVRGRDQGLNADLLVSIEIARLALDRASDAEQRGAAQTDLGVSLWALGERESGTARLEEAVAGYRAALEEYTRERVPLDWAMTQNNLGNALWALGSRESGTARLEEAVTAFRAALEEWTRVRVPLVWAKTQNNLGNALRALGEREGRTARLEEAVAAYRAALEERTRVRVPLDWAATQCNLGTALARLGERESGTARLEEAVAAYRAALEERTRERVPLDWAMTQNNLGDTLRELGQRESGTARLEEAVAAFHAALEEYTRERVPLNWAGTQNNLGGALQRLGERERGTARLEEAVAAYRAALEERTRERVPLDWAMTQNNLGGALQVLGERESGTARLEDAVAAYRAALEEWTRERVPLYWAKSQHNLANALALLAQRRSDPGQMEEALQAMRNAVEGFRQGGDSYALPIAEKRVSEIEAALGALKR